MVRHFLCLADWNREDLEAILRLAEMMKLHPDGFRASCSGKSLAMIFQKPSLRTRVSFEVGMTQMGGHALYLGPRDIQLHRGESLEDTARVLSRYVDVIMARVFSHESVQSLAESASVPVINGLSDLLHPCQVLADLLTIREKKGRLSGLTLAYVGDGNNMAHSLLLGGAIFGMNVSVTHPPGFAPGESIVAQASRIAASGAAKVLATEDLQEGLQGADIVYTDVWASMGQEAEKQERLELFRAYQVDRNVMEMARSDAIFMHCLPAHRGEEVSHEVIDGSRSVVIDQAENRLHAQKALIARLAGGSRPTGSS